MLHHAYFLYCSQLAQAVILKEVQRLHQAQAASSASLFAAAPPPELTANVQARVTTYVRKYMESKGAFYRRRVQQPPVQLKSQQQQHQNMHPSHHHHHHNPVAPPRPNLPNVSIPPQAGGSRPAWTSSAGPVDRVSLSPKPVHNLVGFDGRP
ncbi:unnamed protein product [Echinostoma caproni]|uniref:SRI domain-containing protein n=1 Tax=Echinostoma caproni TaxID=27848 RepID=A0A182ZZ76_9TREM|nr:unnamed protein product [Echinostoma caproni]